MAVIEVTTQSVRGGESFTAKTAYTGDKLVSFDNVPVPATSTVQIDLQLDVSALKTLVVSSDVAVSLKTNSSGSPDNTIAAGAGTPVIWPAYPGQANPLTTDVTTAYLVNAGGAAATVNLRFLADGTP